MNQTNEPAETLNASASSMSDSFTETSPPPLATDAQLDLLADLYTHITSEPAPGPQIDAWQKLTISEADTTITAWKKTLGHASDYTGPEEGTPAYEALTATGQAWADAQMVKEAFVPRPDADIIEGKILGHLQRHGTRTNRQIRDALPTGQRNAMKGVLDHLVEQGTVTATKRYASPAARRPAIVYSLTKEEKSA